MIILLQYYDFYAMEEGRKILSPVLFEKSDALIVQNAYCKMH